MSSLVPRVILPVALVLAACQLLIALALGFLTGAAVSPVAVLALIGAGMVGAVSAALWALCRFVKRPLQSLTAQLAKAKAGAWRIPEKTLFLATALFGGFGGTLGMTFFRHKTKHWYFWAVNIAGLVWQLGLAVFLLVQMLQK